MEQNLNFCLGVQLLLSRMDSNPDEFVGGSGTRWSTLMDSVCNRKQKGTNPISGKYVSALTDAEVDALVSKYITLFRKKFDDYVMKEILNVEEELSYSMTSAPPVVLGNSPYAFGYTDHAQHIALHKAMKEQIEELLND